MTTPQTATGTGTGTNVDAWDRIAARVAAAAPAPDGMIRYGDDLPTERDLRLLGTLASKRVLELGSGTGHNLVALAGQGAKVIAVEPSEQLAAHARQLAERHDVRIEVRVGDLADLAFVRAESIDLALSAGALGEVDDLDRVLRQVHRVLRPNAPIVCAVPHPFALCVDRDGGGAGPLPIGRLVVARDYLDDDPVVVERHGEQFRLPRRSISAMFGAFARAGFAIDQLLELAPDVRADPGPGLPTTLLWRARRLGL
jgi:SAM-dependent methyltransferase